MATPTESLLTRIRQPSWSTIKPSIEKDHPGLVERLSRLANAEDEYRYDRLEDMLPPEQLPPGYDPLAKTTLYRALAAGEEIRPGDKVFISHEHAWAYGRGEPCMVKSLASVDADDIFWAGSTEYEFLYLPKAWRLPGLGPQDLLLSLCSQRLDALLQGERARISKFEKEICTIVDHIQEHVHDVDACGHFHGVDHWHRVSAHGEAVARAMGIDPLVPHIFGLIHDSHREDEGTDPDHGPRAAAFVRDHRNDLFSFLQDEELEDLALACELHSCGQVDGRPHVQACFDADRLDLWRIGVRPLPKYLCTSYAKRPSTIEAARRALMQAADESIKPRYARECD